MPWCLHRHAQSHTKPEGKTFIHLWEHSLYTNSEGTTSAKPLKAQSLHKSEDTTLTGQCHGTMHSTICIWYNLRAIWPDSLRHTTSDSVASARLLASSPGPDKWSSADTLSMSSLYLKYNNNAFSSNQRQWPHLWVTQYYLVSICSCHVG